MEEDLTAIKSLVQNVAKKYAFWIEQYFSGTNTNFEVEFCCLQQFFAKMVNQELGVLFETQKTLSEIFLFKTFTNVTVFKPVSKK